ncbi:beta-N-acetylhexosaminidase [Saccharothrix algeriensis]|uniref:beta-N-acetylhexosaminidase n=1 Tax=Saccharothrix algeriensis TaxID=173560 RepID=A0ABS2S6M1_9PSEU|nr:glycoside hydrolase family 3 N-terminal domain-containing protein [Saccharothrix algeriensis]MBM7811881.1 beta-N-acetylhexosaminidase [Saccharothrix algeriensis]
MLRQLVAAAVVVVASAVPPAAAQPAPAPAQPAPAQPAPPEQLARQSAAALARGMSLEQKVGQLFVTYVHGQAAHEAHPGNRRDFGVDTPAEVVARYQPGGVVYFDNPSYDNIDTPRQVAALSNGLQRAARIPLAVSTDQEMGLVTRIGAPATQFPGNMALGAGRSTRDAERAAAITARELRAMGVNQNFAPDADVNSNPANPVIGVRSYSGDPGLAAGMTAAQVRGYQQRPFSRTAVSATAKHFPGHGDTDEDSHTTLPRVDRTAEQWREVDAPPFRAAIAAGVDSVMTAHIRMPRIDPSGEPATLSKPVLDLLRRELGYDGVVITDSLAMAGVRQLHPDAEIPVLALKAGVDQLLMPVDLRLAIDGVVAAVRSGELTEQRVDRSVLRVLRMKVLRGMVADPVVDEGAVDSVVGAPENTAAAQEITDRTVTAVRNESLPLRAKPTAALVTGWGETTTRTLAGLLGGTALPTGSAPDEARIAAAVDAARSADLVVVLTNGLAGQPAQQALLTRLLGTGGPVVAVAVQNPYDVAHTAAPNWLATYSSGAGSMASVAGVVTGRVRPTGRLPVTVPGPTPYPFGHGLSW